MNGLAAAQKAYDSTTPADTRSDAEIEQDAHIAARMAKQAAATAHYKYDPLAWAGVIAQREAIERSKAHQANN